MKIKHTRRLISVGLVVVLVLVYALTTDNFFTWRNLSLVLLDSAYVGIVALGVAFVIIAGGIDLSVGGIVCTAAIVCARVSCIEGMPGIVAMLVAVLVGCLCGVINGYIITKLHVTEFVTTLAMGFVYTGLGLMLAFRENGRIIAKYLTNESFTAFGKEIGGVYYMTIAWIIIAAIMLVVQSKTRFGLYTYATGSHLKSARMSGVDTDKIKWLGFIICGACAGLAAGFVSAYQSSASASLGSGKEFEAIAASVVGGLVLGGGKGDAIGAMFGALFMTVIMNGLYKYGISTEWQYILQGAIIILATSFDAQFNKINEKRLRALANQ